MNLRRAQLALLLPLALPAPALADVLWVDDSGGPGIDYTDIQAAHDAASHGDVIVVAPGNYTGFVVSKGVTILNSTTNQSAIVTGHSRISSVPAPREVVMTNLRLETLAVSGCSAAVVLDQLRVVGTTATPPGNALVTVTACTDVRMVDCEVRGIFTGELEHAVIATSSRLEVSASELRGNRGFNVDCFDDAGNGGHALLGRSGADLSVFRSDCEGGRGGNTPDFCEWTDPHGGDGGDGVVIHDNSTVILGGLVSDVIEEGAGGWGDTFPCCYLDGSPGIGVRCYDVSAVRYSGVTVTSFWAAGGVSVDTPTPDDPSLDVFGTQQAGRELVFRVHGPPGAVATLYLGRDTALIAHAGQHLEQLTTRERTYPLGVIPPSGQVQLTFTTPNWVPVGFTFHSQAEVILSGGEVRPTNSKPIVMRHLP